MKFNEVFIMFKSKSSHSETTATDKRVRLGRQGEFPRLFVSHSPEVSVIIKNVLN